MQLQPRFLLELFSTSHYLEAPTSSTLSPHTTCLEPLGYTTLRLFRGLGAIVYPKSSCKPWGRSGERMTRRKALVFGVYLVLICLMDKTLHDPKYSAQYSMQQAFRGLRFAELCRFLSMNSIFLFGMVYSSWTIDPLPRRGNTPF